jgi:hypothetical protein
MLASAGPFCVWSKALVSGQVDGRGVDADVPRRAAQPLPAVLPAQVLALRQRLTRQRLRASPILGAFFSPSCDGGKLAASASFTCC